LEYPHRRVSQEDIDIRSSSNPVTKGGSLVDEIRPSKKPKEQ
jgi:hypothetical protein